MNTLTTTESASQAETFQAFATCPQHLELLLKDELVDLGAFDVKEKLKGVEFQADSRCLMRTLLWSRLANRIFVHLQEFKVTDAKDLYNAAYQITWLNHLKKTPETLSVNFIGKNKELRNTQYASQVVKDGICDHIRNQKGTRPDIVKSAADLMVSARLKNNILSIDLDISGRSLHQRGYRQSLTAAPLKENLAAAILIRMGWREKSQQGYNLIDPMCGSGTFLTEGYLMACDIAPGLIQSDFSIKSWIHFEQKIWDELLIEAKSRMQKGRESLHSQIMGADHHKASIEIAKEHSYQLNAEKSISFVNKTLEHFSIPAKNNLIISNPPYGIRLKKNIDTTWKNLGNWLSNKANGATFGVLTHAANQGFLIGYRCTKSWKFLNGEIPIELMSFDINPKAKLNLKNNQMHALSEAAQMVANRIQKNQKNLNKWLQKEQITCYRVYDADIPEYAAAIDVYDKHLHIQEYKAPAQIPEKKAQKRLQDLILAAQSVFNAHEHQTHVKTRFKQSKSNQYEKQNSSKKPFVITEQGRKYLIDLDSYLDSGLFLDHRWVRQHIESHSKNKRFLNLFCYTSSVTVAAAKGGATQSVSVDASKAYLNWSRENFKLNKMDRLKHSLVRSDVMDYLKRCSKSFDLIFVDPPTYSNSHSRASDWDVQRDHVELLKLCKKVLNPDGEIVFSNNFKKFSLDAELNNLFNIKDLTQVSQSADFKKSKIKRVCYSLKLKQTDKWNGK